jgi:hypothetical protein
MDGRIRFHDLPEGDPGLGGIASRHHPKEGIPALGMAIEGVAGSHP